jgi:predicted HTH transcriptional regulator
MPVNPLLAEPMCLFGTIERMGTGTRDIVKRCKALGLKEPEFEQEEFFKTVLWRDDTPEVESNEEKSGQKSGQLSENKISILTSYKVTILLPEKNFH